MKTKNYTISTLEISKPSKHQQNPANKLAPQHSRASSLHLCISSAARKDTSLAKSYLGSPRLGIVGGARTHAALSLFSRCRRGKDRGSWRARKKAKKKLAIGVRLRNRYPTHSILGTTEPRGLAPPLLAARALSSPIGVSAGHLCAADYLISSHSCAMCVRDRISRRSVSAIFS